MKNNILIKIATTFSFILFSMTAVFGQMDFNRLSLMGPDYKIIRSEPFLRYSLQIDFGQLMPSEKGLDRYNGGGIDSLLMRTYSDPFLFEQLFETLGGEFFIGSFTAEPQFENFQQRRTGIFSISGGVRFNSKLEGKIQLSKYQSEIKADFPIVVFDENTFEDKTSSGALKTNLKTTTVQITGNYYPFDGLIQPYGGLGIIYNHTKPSQTKAQIGEVVFGIAENPAERSFGLVFQAGTAIMIHSKLFLQVNTQLFSSETRGDTMVWNKVIGGGIGVRF